MAQGCTEVGRWLSGHSALRLSKEKMNRESALNCCAGEIHLDDTRQRSEGRSVSEGLLHAIIDIALSVSRDEALR